MINSTLSCGVLLTSKPLDVKKRGLKAMPISKYAEYERFPYIHDWLIVWEEQTVDFFSQQSTGSILTKSQIKTQTNWEFLFVCSTFVVDLRSNFIIGPYLMQIISPPIFFFLATLYLLYFLGLHDLHNYTYL